MRRVRRHTSSDFEHSDTTASLVRKADEAGKPLDAGTIGAFYLAEDDALAEATARVTAPSRQRDTAERWMWEDSPQSKEVLLALFMMVDKLGDGSGCMSSTELMHVLINLGEDVDDECADEMCDIVDYNRDGEISFEEFYNVMTGRLNLEAQVKRGIYRTASNSTIEGAEHLVAGSSRSIRDIKALFDAIDEDKSGYLDREEVRNLAKKMGEDLNRRHLIDAMKAMDPTGSGKVTFQMFRNWLVDTRDGRHWTDFLVLAEGQVQAIRDLAFNTEEFVQLQSALDSGTENHAILEWKRLAILLKMMGRTTTVWGSPEAMYGQQNEPSVQKLRAKASKVIHVGNIQNDSELENEGALRVAFSQFGNVVAVTLRKRHELVQGTDEVKVSWALVSFEHSSSARAAVVSSADVASAKVDEKKLVVRKLDMDLALKSVGAMGDVARAHAKEVKQNTLDFENVEDIEKEARARRCFFSPDSTVRVVWDLMMVVLLFYLVVTVPVQIAFGIEIEFGTWSFWFDIFVDVYFLCDMILNTQTAYVDDRGVMEINRKRICKHYVRGWFIVDFVTCIPISYIMLLINDDATRKNSPTRAFKIVRLTKLSKLLRMSRILKFVERYRDQLRVVMNTAGGFVWAFLVFVMAHLFATGWYYMGTVNQEYNVASTTPALDGWVRREFGEDDCSPRSAFASDSESDNSTSYGVAGGGVCLFVDNLTRYLTAYYWALMTITTVGYGDIIPLTDYEKVFACMAMLCGALLFSAVSGEMASRFMVTKGTVSAFNTRMDEVRQLMADKQIPVSQRRQIEAHFRFLWESKAVYDEREILELLPSSLRDPILDSQYLHLISNCALFSMLNKYTAPGRKDGAGKASGYGIMNKIVRELTHTVAMHGMIVIAEGEYGDEMYFIEKGEVDVYRTSKHADKDSDDDECYSPPTRRTIAADQLGNSGIGDSLNRKRIGALRVTPPSGRYNYVEHGGEERVVDLGVRLGRLGPSAFFGERAVLTRGNGLKRGVRTRTIMSRSACTFHVLHKKALDRLRREIPHLNRMMNKVESVGKCLWRDSLATENARRPSVVEGSAAGNEGLIPRRDNSAELFHNELKRLGDQTEIARAQSMRAHQTLKKQVEGLEQQMVSVVSAVEKLSMKLDKRPEAF